MAFNYPSGYTLFAGVDEVGRGPLVGAVVTAAVILDPKIPIIGLTDSKKLSEKKRRLLAEEIKEKALAWALGRAEPTEIDRLNILHASLLAMTRAIKSLKIRPHFVFYRRTADKRQFPTRPISCSPPTVVAPLYQVMPAGLVRLSR